MGIEIIGLKIAATGMVMFIFCLFVACIANSEPRQPKMTQMFALGMIVGFFLIPIGLIIQIWQ